MKISEAKEALARTLDISYTDIANNDLFSATDLLEFIKTAVLKAWDYKGWDFSEGAKTGTTDGTDYYDYPADFVSGSINFLAVAGEEYDKREFHDYQRQLESDPSTTEKIWAEYNRFIFINKNAYTTGETFDAFGKLKAPVLSADTDLLPFSPDTDNEEYSGNSAIVQLAKAEALGSEKMKNPTQALAEQKEAYATLDILWKPFAESRSTQKSPNTPFFNVPNFFGPSSPSSPIGNFN